MLFVLLRETFSSLSNSISSSKTYQTYFLINQFCFPAFSRSLPSILCKTFLWISHTLLQFICLHLLFPSLIIRTLRARILLIDWWYRSCPFFLLLPSYLFCTWYHLVYGEFLLFSPLDASCFMTQWLIYSHVFVLFSPFQHLPSLWNYQILWR